MTETIPRARAVPEVATATGRSGLVDGPPSAALVIGFGPAGLGVFLGALRDGFFADLVRAGARAVDRRPPEHAGRLGRYSIDSDSTLDSFVAGLGHWATGAPEPHFVAHGPWARDVIDRHRSTIDAGRGKAVPLHWAGGLQQEMSEIVMRRAAAVTSDVLVRVGSVESAQLQPDGSWIVEGGAGAPARHVTSLVLATGAHQPLELLRDVVVAGRRPAVERPTVTLGSDQVLARDGLASVNRVLRGSKAPRAVIVGGSHSALAAARVLLAGVHGWGEGSIVVAHRSPLRPMFSSAQNALAEGFSDFTQEDICPLTGRVFPLGGFRLASGELLRSLLGLGGRDPEPRVRLHHIRPHGDQALGDLLDAADVVVLATGYEREMIRLRGVEGTPLRLRGGPGRGYVDAQAQVLDAAGAPVPGLYATGLAAGHPLAGTHGEPSFDKLANGTALWQGEIGSMIARRVMERHRVMGDSQCR